MKENLLLIDGSSLLFRAFYAIPPLSNADGIPTNGVYGFLNMYENLLEQFNPNYILIAFDRSGPTFRHRDYEDYKGTREKAPSELETQFGLLHEVLDAMNVNHIDMDEYEADDIIGTIAKANKSDELNIHVITGDKDLLQLVDKNIDVYLTRRGITNMDKYDLARFHKEYGIEPEQLIDVKALMGDQSDNIPGIPGIGEKRALQYIQNFHSVEGLYENIEEITGPKTKQSIIDNKIQAFMSKKLSEIYTKVPMEKEKENFPIKEEDTEKTIYWFEKLNFRTLAASRSGQIKTKKIESAEIINLEKANEWLDKNIDDSIAFKFLFDDDLYTWGKVKYLAFGNREDIFLLEKKEDWNEFLTKFFSAGERITFDGKEGFFVIAKNNIELKSHVDDLLLIEYLNNPGQSNINLGMLARNYLSENLTDPKEVMGTGKNKKPLGLVEEDKLVKFVAENIWAMNRLQEPVKKKLKDLKMLNLYEDIELPLAYILADMESTGVAVDGKVLEDLGNELKSNVKDLTEKIYEKTGHEFNINSPKQLGEILFDEMGLPIIKRTKTGYSTDMEVLEKLSEDGYDIADDIIDYRQMQKLISTYIDGLLASIQEDGRVRTIFRQTITATGRLSSTDPNIQNIPIRSEEGQKIRKAFVASDEHILLDADYSQIELRILAHLAQDENMVNAFIKNIDIHKKTAAEVFHEDLENVTDLQRDQAKAVNFGIIYGISDYGLSKNLKIPRKEAKEYIDKYLDSYPYVKKYMEDIIEQAKKDGYVETLFKRRRYIPELKQKNRNIRAFGERVALNTPIQGTAADIIKIAMIKVYNQLKEKSLKSKLILQVHDELIVDVKKGEEEIVKKIIEDEMGEAAQLSVPLIVDINWGKDWYES